MSQKSATATRRLHCVVQHCSHTRNKSTARLKMTQKTYSNGSAFPPKTPGLMRIYSMRFCPWAQRTRLILEHKKIPYETVNVDLKDKPDWFLEKNPLGLVPVLEIDDKIVYESTATSDWLDDVYPGDRLQPSDPYRKAWDRIVTEYYGKLAGSIYGLLRNPENKEQAVADTLKHYQFFENVLAKRKGPFFGDDKPSLVDFLIWPHFERVPVVATVEPRVVINREKFPRLAAWFDAVSALPAVQSTSFDAKTHLQFLESSKSGKPNYDLGLEE
uniref:Glutathione S-transferase omega n=2 Tax=Arion vulgaris TaxID=1028688 RepID=A0A0B7B1M6_9EUPU